MKQKYKIRKYKGKKKSKNDNKQIFFWKYY